MTLIDTHAHLDQIDNLEESLKEAVAVGVEAIVAVSVDLAANKKNLAIKDATKSPKIYVALGIHPGDIKSGEIDKTISFIRENVRAAVAIGEIGLDYWYKWVKKDDAQKEEQRDVFKKQLIIAKENDLPVLIHSRGAWRDCLKIAKDVGVKKVVFHWYSGPVDVLDEILGFGYYISATPSLAYSPQAQEAIKHAPITQSLIETDCPVYYRDKNAESGFSSRPKDVFKTLQLYADLKQMDKNEALTILNANAYKFFGIT